MPSTRTSLAGARRLCAGWLLAVAAALSATAAAAAPAGGGFPRLLGMNIGEKNYDDPAYQAQLARLDIVILGFYRGWHGKRPGETMRDVVRTLKHLNPQLLVGQYTLLNEANIFEGDSAQHDKLAKLDHESWWLRRADGSRVQWTSQYQAWDINVTDWSAPDAAGRRYPQWLAQRDYRVFFEPVPEFDIWYFDNVMAHQRIAAADWKREGRDQSGTDPGIQTAFRRGEARHWLEARALAPGLLQMGNADNDLSFPEYKGRLQGVFLEGLMGKRWSLYERKGWDAMMTRYHDVFGNLAAPRIVGFNVAGDPHDYRFFRFAFASSLMDDGYFSFTDEKKGYSSVPWFDEYDAALGQPLDPPQHAAGPGGVYRRRFERGLALVNPGSRSARIEIGEGYVRLRGRQAPEVNTGCPARTVTLAPHDGLVLMRAKRGDYAAATCGKDR